jgi:hypothetical protein
MPDDPRPALTREAPRWPIHPATGQPTPPATGRYYNPATMAYECWAVNGRTGAQTLLATYAAWRSDVEVAQWEREVWRAFLAGEFRAALSHAEDVARAQCVVLLPPEDPPCE